MNKKKVRVYELAKELGLENQDLIRQLKVMGYDAETPMASIPLEDVDEIRQKVDPKYAAAVRRDKEIDTRENELNDDHWIVQFFKNEFPEAEVIVKPKDERFFTIGVKRSGKPSDFFTYAIGMKPSKVNFEDVQKAVAVWRRKDKKKKD